MRLGLSIRRQRLRPRLQVQLRPLLTSKQRPRLRPAPPRHLHLPVHPARPRNQVRVRNKVRARSQLLALTPPRHRPVNNMNFETTKFDLGGDPALVGRGSRTTENCFRSAGRLHTLGSVRPMDAPSRGTELYQVFSCDLGPQTTCEQSSRWVRLGESVGLAHSNVGTSRRPCDHQLVVREPRPTKLAATNHQSLITNHLSRLVYVRS